MNQTVRDVMTVSLTINFCVLLVVVLPRLRERFLATPSLKRYKSLTKICLHYAEKPRELSKILTNQIVLCSLVVSSLIAICASDVIRHPFHPETPTSGVITFIKTLFAINIGRYIFVIVEKMLSKQVVRVAKSRTDAVHHFVSVSCYILFLAYVENLLIGLVGILVESTSVLDDIGRYCKEKERRQTKFYRRLVVFNCVGTICFRGVIPTVFLIIGMFQQSPFTMTYVSLTVFFLSIIFFSVINVWQILLGLQRLFNQLSETRSTIDSFVTETEVVRPHFGTLVRHNSRGAVRLKIAKNNLGYIKPYENKNIASYTDEKQNVNNKKECSKETIELHVSPEIFLKSRNMRSEKYDNNTSRISNIQRRHSFEETDLRESIFRDGLPSVLFLSGRRQLRDSNSTTSTSSSDTALVTATYRSTDSDSIRESLNNNRDNFEEVRQSILANIGPQFANGLQAEQNTLIGEQEENCISDVVSLPV